MEAHRSLILRGNRALGAHLTERGLISDDDFSRANERLMEVLQEGRLKNANLLEILCHELKVMNEDSLVSHLVEEHALGLVDLANIEITPLINEFGIDPDLCRATGTTPFSFRDEVVCLATTAYVSRPVVRHWEELLKRQVIWYGTSLVSMMNALSRLPAQAGGVT